MLILRRLKVAFEPCERKILVLRQRPLSRIGVARRMNNMLRRLRRRELLGRRLGRKPGRRNARFWMSDARLRKQDDGKRRRNSRSSRRGNVRSGRLGRRLIGSVKRRSYGTGTANVTAKKRAEIATGTETEIEIGIVIRTGREIGMIDTEDTMTIRDPADIPEMTETAEIAIETRSRSQNYQKRRLNDLSRRLWTIC